MLLVLSVPREPLLCSPTALCSFAARCFTGIISYSGVIDPARVTSEDEALKGVKVRDAGSCFSTAGFLTALQLLRTPAPSAPRLTRPWPPPAVWSVRRSCSV